MNGRLTGEPARRLLLALAVTVVGLTAIFIAEDLPTRHNIESTLEHRALTALHAGGINNVTVNFTGRDGAIRVRSAAEVDRARSIVQDQEGVRVARVTVAPAVPSPPAVAAPATTPASPLPPEASPSPELSPSLGPSSSPGPSSPPAGPPPASTADEVHRQIVAAGPVEFASGSATLTVASGPVLARIAAILEANPTMKVRIEGNTDSVGSAAGNLALSRRRAQTVYDALAALRVARDRMTTIGYGETRPQVPNTTDRNRAINRRVTFTVSE